MANSNGWGDGAANNSIGWGQGANNAIAWGDSHAKSWAGATDIVGLTTDPAASAYFTATGITGATQQTAIDNLVKGLKQDGLWSKMKAVYPFVTDNRNLLSYTEDFGNAYWSVNNSTTSINSTTAPNGTTTADSFIEDSTTSFKYIINPVTINGVVGETYTVSIYAKANTLATIQLTYSSSEFNNNYANFNLSNGSIGTYLGVVPTITSVGNGWYRCSMTNTMTTSGSVRFFVVLTNSSSAPRAQSYLGTGKSLFIWGAQLELGSTATTYQAILTTQQAFIANQFKYNLVNPVDSDAAFRLVFNGGWTHSANGATPNGTNGYADTKLVPSSVLTLNSTHISSYIRNTSQGILLGSDVVGRLWIAPNFNGTQKYLEINTGMVTTPSATISTATGLWLGSRIVSSQSKLYNNASINYSHNTSSVVLDTLPIYLSARNASGNASNYTSAQVAFSSIGDGLTDTEAANLYTRVQAFQTALSRQV